ncbi:transglutaminase domain-containing protein, partial [Candidatus Nomurabacteria bacterium]|nr:transglutaminase domain-containing protein [Candidatus Nomurabacteria bacterium]
VDQVLDEIIDPGMSDLEKMSEIFYWIADHINYIGTSDKSDWIKGAYLGMTRGTGDCFNYFAAAKAFLTRAGYETIPIERVKDAKTRHYWNLVKYEGEWYHFDPLPNLAKYHYVCLLRTDAEVAEYSKKNTRFYEFDKTGIPATATKPLDIERKVING